jgi:hypothetical protein
MRKYLTGLLIFISSCSFAQFAVIHDGYSLVRSAPDSNATVIDTLKNGSIVYSFEQNGNWTDVDYAKKKMEVKGYVNSDRLRPVLSYDEIPHLAKGMGNVVLGKDSIRVTITEQRFNRKLHKLTYLKGSRSQIEYIDGREFWGTDGELPYNEYRSIAINVGSRKFLLPKAALANLYQPRLSDTQVNYDRINNVFYIQSTNSDGAGFYAVIWKIEKGIYKDRLVIYGF